jgi:hypothetical protein
MPWIESARDNFSLEVLEAELAREGLVVVPWISKAAERIPTQEGMIDLQAEAIVTEEIGIEIGTETETTTGKGIEKEEAETETGIEEEMTTGIEIEIGIDAGIGVGIETDAIVNLDALLLPRENEKREHTIRCEFER